MRELLLICAGLVVSLGTMLLGIWLGEPLAGFVFGIAAVCALLKLAEKVGWA